MGRVSPLIGRILLALICGFVTGQTARAQTPWQNGVPLSAIALSAAPSAAIEQRIKIRRDVLAARETRHLERSEPGQSEPGIYIFGAVNRPGPYHYRAGETVLDALARAGGPNGAADLSSIRLSGHGVIDLKRHMNAPTAHPVPRLSRGVVIFVPEAGASASVTETNGIRVLGAVGNPGLYDHSGGMTVLSLLRKAGGLDQKARGDKIVIVRRINGEVQAELFDMEEYADNPNPQRLPPLNPGDAVYVPFEGEGQFSLLRKIIGGLVSVGSLALLVGGI